MWRGSTALFGNGLSVAGHESGVVGNFSPGAANSAEVTRNQRVVTPHSGVVRRDGTVGARNFTPVWRHGGEVAGNLQEGARLRLRAASRLAAEREFRLEHGLAGDRGGGLCLNEVPQSAGDARFESNHFAGAGGAENFHAAHRGQF